MDVDRLSQVFDLIDVRGVVTGGFAGRDRWVVHDEVHVRLKFIAVVSGRAELTTDGWDGPLELAPGDVAILNGRSWRHLEGGTGTDKRTPITPSEEFFSAGLAAADHELDDVIIGGHIDVAPAGLELLQGALPPVAHIRSGSTWLLRESLQHLLDEVSARQLGSAFAIRQYGQLVLLEVLRAYLRQSELRPGWLGALQDERLAPALDLMHDQPERAWTLPELARAAAMSRTAFIDRFRRVAGVPPLTYLSQWRMLLARQALRDDDVRVGPLAAQLGFGSESAFSTAFKRVVGESPLRYRQRIRAGDPDDFEPVQAS